MMIRFRFLLFFFTQRSCSDLRCQALTYLRSGLARTSAARPSLTYAAALLGPPLPGPYLLTYLLTNVAAKRVALRRSAGAAGWFRR